MPEVTKMTLAEAKAALAENDVEDYKINSGTTGTPEDDWLVTRQSPSEGQEIAGGASVELIVRSPEFLADSQSEVDAVKAEAQAAQEKAEAARKAAAEKAEAERKAAEAKRKAQEKARQKARIDNATEVSARQLSKIAKSPDDYIGKTLVVYGEVSQFDAATGECTFRADIGNTNMAYSWSYEYNSIFTSGDGESDCPKLDDIVQDDEVRMTVTSLGSFSYDTQIGGRTTVPMFKVERISRVQ